MLRDQNATIPSKLWYIWFNPGASHAPHHTGPEWVDKYKGVFDDSYKVSHGEITQAMIDKDSVPEGTVNTALNFLPENVANPADAVRPWDSLNDDEKSCLPTWPRFTPVIWNIPTGKSAVSPITCKKPDNMKTR